MITSITVTLDLKTAATLVDILRSVKPALNGSPHYDELIQIEDVLSVALQDAWKKNRLERMPKRIAGLHETGSGV